MLCCIVYQSLNALIYIMNAHCILLSYLANNPIQVNPHTFHFCVSQFGSQLWFINLALLAFGLASIIREFSTVSWNKYIYFSEDIKKLARYTCMKFNVIQEIISTLSICIVWLKTRRRRLTLFWGVILLLLIKKYSVIMNEWKYSKS